MGHGPSAVPGLDHDFGVDVEFFAREVMVSQQPFG
jgi:hypothetical protein